MSQANGQSATVVGNDGVQHEVATPNVDVKFINNFIEMYRTEYFEDHSFQWCLDQIVERGMAEIKRYVKTNASRKEQMALGALAKEYNLTPETAREVLKAALAARK
jgi:hypothetical protein